MTLFRAVSPDPRPWHGASRATPEDARLEAVRRAAGDAWSNDELRAQIWRSLARAGWRIEEVNASGRHVAWVGDGARSLYEGTRPTSQTTHVDRPTRRRDEHGVIPPIRQSR